MNPRSSEDAMGLRGAEYVRHNQPAATRDEVASRWVAVDESGWDGEQLYGRGSRYLVLGSVAIDDRTAAPIVDQLRRKSGVVQPPELKAAQFTRSRDGRRLDALADLLAPDGPLANRVRIYMVDKHYFITGKIVDLLLDEHFSARGLDMYEGGFARQLARILFNDGPRALGNDGFARLIKTMVDFASMRNRNTSQVSVDMLFDEIERAWARSTRRTVTAILFQLRGTRTVADDFLRALNDIDNFQAMEPLIPCLASVVDVWAKRVDGIRVLVDEQRVFTDSTLDNVRKLSGLEIGPLGRLTQTGAPSRADDRPWGIDSASVRATR